MPIDDASDPQSSRRPDIQGLRAIAVIMVVAYHSGLPVPGGFVGVDVFFVVSGFVITGMLRREWSTTGRISFGRFYRRRFMRLTPALALMVTATVLLSCALLSPLGPLQTAAETAIGAIFLVANLVISMTTGGYFDAPAESNPLLNTWSLSVEEQFYLVFPAIVAISWLIVRRSPRSRWVPPVVFAALTATSFTLALLGSIVLFRGGELLLGFYSPVARMWEFGAGALLALAAGKFRISSVRLAAAVGLIGAGMIGAGAFVIDGATPLLMIWTLIPVVGTVLLLLAGTQQTNQISHALATGPMVKIGDWSYSIYLWHWPVIVFSSVIWPGNPSVLLVAAVASFIPAIISFMVVEQPMRRMDVSNRTRLAKVVVLTLTPPLLASGAVCFAAENQFWSQSVLYYQGATEPFHTAEASGCANSIPLTPTTAANCTWNKAATGRPIYLVGDSNADQFSEGIIGAGSSLNRPVIIATADACPLVDVTFQMVGMKPAWNDQCQTYVDDTLDFLTNADPGLVIMGAADEYWSSPEFLVGTDGQDLSSDTGIKLEAFRNGLSATATALKAAGHEVLLIQTPPHWKEPHLWNPKSCTFVTVLNRQCSQQMPVGDAQKVQGRVRELLRSVAGEAGANVVDFWDALCPGGICSTQIEEFVRYRDQNHISVQQSRALQAQFEQVIGGTEAR